MATHSSILAWRIPWTEEPGGVTVHGVAKSWTWLRTLEWIQPIEYYLAITKKQCTGNVADWINLENIVLSESKLSGNVWREDSSVLSLISPLSLFKRDSMLLPGTEVIVWGRLGSPLVNILFRTKLLSLVPLSWDMDCLLTLWLTFPLVPLVTVAVHLVFWSLSFPKEVSRTTAYIYS